MRIHYTKYEHAPMATTVSFLGSTIGSLSVGGGILALFSKEFVVGLVVIAFGIGLVVGSTILSEKMAESASFKRWWKQVKNAKLEPEIAKSVDVAVQLYKKNPQQRTLNKITRLNPAAGEYIRKHRNRT